MTPLDRVPREISQAAMPEAVRLVIWDLDDTFWKGTITEGGIREYVQKHHDIVVELARRGIMSSICSKNDFATVEKVLEERGIFNYFIFPNISWEPKGARLAATIEAVQLRPAAVMFIDDNPNNRAEATAVVPNIQVADETFIAQMLEDPRFRGKDDNKMTRLAQYKLLESRKRDEKKASGDNVEFLRSCDVRAYIEYDLSSHLDRAIELINRTNQLNYTKKRLPEDLEAARRLLIQQSREAGCQTGLIRVMDNYGDYGFVGFFMLKNGRRELSLDLAGQTLVHYCFSCRTLGMLVEHWCYSLLRRPELDVIGEVLTDLAEPRTIDWIRLVPSLAEGAPPTEKVAPEIRLHGGCEANAIAHYLTTGCDAIHVTGNFAAGSYFVRVNSGSLLLSSCDHAGPEMGPELAALGIPLALLGGNFFNPAPPGTLFVFNGGLDAGNGQHRYRHCKTGFELKLEINGCPLLNFVSDSEDELRKVYDMRFASSTPEKVATVVWHIRDHYEAVNGVGPQGIATLMATLFGRVPTGSKFIVVLDDPRVRGGDGVVRTAPWTTRYNEQVGSIAAAFPFVGVVSFADFIRSEDEIQVGGNHYDRMVYCRLAAAIIAAASRTPAKVIATSAASCERVASRIPAGRVRT